MPFASYGTDDYKADLQNFVKACGSQDTQNCHRRVNPLELFEFQF